MRQDEPRYPGELDDAALDRLLMQAAWPQPSAESTDRLYQSWLLMRARSSRSIWRSTLAVAASLAAVFFGTWMFRHSANNPVRPNVVPTVILVSRSIQSAGRPATNIELAVLRMIDVRMRSDKSNQIVAPAGVPLVPVVTGWAIHSRATAASPAQPAPVDATALAQRAMGSKDMTRRDHLLDDLIAIGPNRAGQPVINLLAQPETAVPIIAALTRHPQDWSDTLFAALSDPRVLVRSCAAQALAQIDGPVITARLIMMANTDKNRREAVAALVQIHSTTAQSYVENAKQSSELGAIVRSALAQNVTVSQKGNFQ